MRGFSADKIGCHWLNDDSFASVFIFKRSGEKIDENLWSWVNWDQWERPIFSDRWNVYDDTFLSLHHIFQDDMCHHHESGSIQIYNVGKIFFSLLQKEHWFTEHTTNVIHQHTNTFADQFFLYRIIQIPTLWQIYWDCLNQNIRILLSWKEGANRLKNSTTRGLLTDFSFGWRKLLMISSHQYEIDVPLG